MSKNSFYIAQITEEKIKEPSNPTFGHIFKKTKETEQYIAYSFSWIDTFVLGEEKMPGQFHDVELWQLKNYDGLYVIFANYENFLQHFYTKINHLRNIPLKTVSFDFSQDLHKAVIQNISTIIDGDKRVIHNENQIKNQQVLKHLKNYHSITYHLNFLDRLKTLELYSNNHIKFGIEKNDDVVYEIVKYILSFSVLEEKNS